MRAKFPLIAVTLALTNIALGMAVGWRLWQGSRLHQLTASVEPQLRVAAAGWDVPAPVALEALQSQAIFHHSRSFYVAPPPQQIQQPPPDYRLAGSMSVPGKQLSATLVHVQTGARMKVSAGDQLEGWTVVALAPGKVTVQLAERTVEITSAPRSPAAGVTLISAQPLPAAPVAGGVRVLGSANAPAGTVIQPGNPAETGLRLYRPPN